MKTLLKIAYWSVVALMAALILFVFYTFWTVTYNLLTATMVVGTVEALAIGIPALISLIFLGTMAVIYIVTNVSGAMARAMAKLALLGDPVATRVFLYVLKEQEEEERMWRELEEKLREVRR